MASGVVSCGGASLEGSGAYTMGFFFSGCLHNGLLLPALRGGSFPGLRGEEGESTEEDDGLCGEEGRTESKISSPFSL